MNAGLLMGQNQFGQTVLQPQAEVVEPEPGLVTEPHLDSSGEFKHNQSVRNSPTLQRFLQEFGEKARQQTVSNEQEQTPPEPGDVVVSSLDEYVLEFDEPKPERTVVRAPSRQKRFSEHTVAKFCPECGLGFGGQEKFCPHCGTKRTAYTAPSA
ncbi:MAG: zinc ribbon domain-containing protein [Armatimonadetes bacterium]|nr:zinc ribbon domain-containing protein [Armatimonadota bacterium]